jgi:murein L,D-transpeptidase YcbB/YkuD
MEIVQGRDHVMGDSVTPDLVAQLAAGSLRVRQRPGPRNALGRVRFDFPNDSNVYLHDTSQPELFAGARRDLSHGCIRVERAAELARWTLRLRPGWESSDSVERALAGPDSRRVALPEPIAVVLEYRTATVRPDGAVWFFPDIYGLDATLSRALEASDRRGGSAD